MKLEFTLHRPKTKTKKYQARFWAEDRETYEKFKKTCEINRITMSHAFNQFMIQFTEANPSEVRGA